VRYGRDVATRALRHYITMPRWNLVVRIKWFIIGRISLNSTSSTIRKWISRSRFIILMRDRYLRLIWTRWTLRWI